MTKRYVKAASYSDGWDEEKLEDILAVTDEIYNLAYEIRNAVRGAYSRAHTYEELAEYALRLGNDLVHYAEDLYDDSDVFDMEDSDEY